MKKVGWILFSLTALMLAVKFYIIFSDQIAMLQMLDEVVELRSRKPEYFNHHWLFVEPTLILISLFGFLLRKKLGFQLSLIFVYFVIAYGLLHYLTPVDRHENFHFGLMNWALLIGILINLPATVRVFAAELRRVHQLRANVVSLIVGLLLNGILLVITA